MRTFRSRGSGSLVNISSPYGCLRAASVSVFVATKHAVEGLIEAAALRVAETGVPVNVVASGTTDTGMLTRFTNTAKNKAVGGF
jgi:short-subunit dehydrogenase